ncbi:hypothetical protein T03_2900 [Trichinella britovi]|uniref:Uncharacterized protein n=1 Tax=Trichinella britovi TaxID=45882 RepID=A0A0V1CLG2_TRIBR|nr:hypothetical protein T03_2900 [Trichinella britovi]
MRQCYWESAKPEERAAEPAEAKRRIWSRGRTGPSSPSDDSAGLVPELCKVLGIEKIRTTA